MTSSFFAVQRVIPPVAPCDLANRTMRRLLSSPRYARRLGEYLLVLHVTGRRSGLVIDVPVAYRPQDDGRLLVLTNSVWRLNLRDASAVEVTWHAQRRSATAELVEDPQSVADVYATLIDDVGRDKATRQLGVRINVDRAPTREELIDAAVRDGLSLVHLRVGGVL